MRLFFFFTIFLHSVFVVECASFPQFGCSNCKVSDNFEHYYKTKKNDTLYVQVNDLKKKECDIHIDSPIQYRDSHFELFVHETLLCGNNDCDTDTGEKVEAYTSNHAGLDWSTQSAYSRIAKMKVDQLNGPYVALRMESKGKTIRWRAKCVPEIESIHKLLIFPILLAHVHGSYWSDLYYFYIYFIVSGLMVLSYIVYKKPKHWRACLLMSLVFFVSNACDKLYHLIMASQDFHSTRLIILSFCVSIMCVEGIPCAVVGIILQRGRNYPRKFKVALLFTCIGSVFAIGSGYYGGPALLLISLLLWILQI